MKLGEVVEALECEVAVGQEDPSFREIEVEVGCGADLMSDVLAFIKPASVLLTGLTTAQVVRTAVVADVRAIVYVRNKKPDQKAVDLAREGGIPLLCTPLLMFEACGRLYAHGLRGGTETKSEGAVHPQ
jgi:hypothetical protein